MHFHFGQPDLVAPGLHILAAFSPMPSISGAQEDNRHAGYNFMSGTSMSCPHAAGIAAYVKSFHPNWSPAAIKSALITTGSNFTFKFLHPFHKKYIYSPVIKCLLLRQISGPS